MARLNITDGDASQTLELQSRRITAGRDKANDIVLTDRESSRKHFAVEPAGNAWRVVDLESRNGTKVNGETVNQAVLKSGDVISVGNAEATFESDTVSARTSRAAESRTRARTARASTLARSSAAQAAEREDKMVKNLVVGVVVVLIAFTVLAVLSSLTAKDPNAEFAAIKFSEAQNYETNNELHKALNAYRAVPREAEDYFRQARARMEAITNMIKQRHESDKMGAAMSNLAELKNFANANPNDVQGVLEKAKEFKRLYPGTLDEEVNKVVEATLENRQQLSSETYQKVRDAARKDIDAGSYGKAALAVQQYMSEFTNYDTAADLLMEEIFASGQDYFNTQRAAAEKLVAEKKYREAEQIFRSLKEKFAGSEDFSFFTKFADDQVDNIRYLEQQEKGS